MQIKKSAAGFGGIVFVFLHLGAGIGFSDEYSRDLVWQPGGEAASFTLHLNNVRLLTQPGAGTAPTRPALVIRFKDAADRLGCAVRTVRSYVEQGRLDPVRAKERAIGVTESSLERMANGLCADGAVDCGRGAGAGGFVPAMA